MLVGGVEVRGGLIWKEGWTEWSGQVRGRRGGR